LIRKLARWLAGAAAIGFAYFAYVYLSLPDVRPLRTDNPATTAFIELRADEARDKGQPPRRVQQWVPYSRISQDLKRAVLVAEDAAFWDHQGVDYEALQESLEADWARRRFLRGGSTITQQLAKNLYLSPSKNPIRKLRELIIARRLEAELPKSRILELYLNEIEWGDGIYGAEAAARTYFHTSASALGRREAALLAACIINPRVMNPMKVTTRLAGRQQLILGRMGAVVPPVETPQAGQAPLPAAAEPSPSPEPSQPIEGAPDAPPPAAPETPAPAEPPPPDDPPVRSPAPPAEPR
jgi:monofunctional biosynthetic peptidoglycan transglycosylase